MTIHGVPEIKLDYILWMLILVQLLDNSLSDSDEVID